MLRADFYPHATDDPITLVQTHISWVLLTGPYAYKVKKPVDLGFVDFSTLERRRHFCDEEVRLNRRGAPGIYLEVVAIVERAEGYRLDGPGEAVEYAVKMRQFPADAQFSRMLPEGRVNDALIERLARTVAEYHAAAESNDFISQFGRPQAVRQSIEDNYRHTQRFIGGTQTREQFEGTRLFTENFFADRSALLTARVESRRIRQCHGDLHLGNICLWEEEIQLFDCIEFNEAFRFIDVIQDAAFAAMDLAAGGRADLATLFLNEYVERTGDWDAFQVLPLYLTRHAYVRAKVNSILWEDAQLSAAARDKARQQAELYYRLAYQYTRPRQGRIIAMSGLSGSGKSTVARRLARESGAVVIRSDAVRKHLAGIPLDQRGRAEMYSAGMTQRTYDRMLTLATSITVHGGVAILDARYDRRDLRLALLARAREAGLPLQFLHCLAPPEVLRDRLNRRQGDVSDATADLLAAQEAQFEPFSDPERPFVTTVHTGGGCYENDLRQLGIPPIEASGKSRTP
ncbi:MAG TPA: AAA family ATPase [Tepidisphaeraceae bacterium]